MADLAGSLVVVDGLRDLGTGRIAAVDGATVRVEWFESVAEPVAHSEQVPLNRCRKKQLSPQTRAYWRTGQRWRVGRVVWGDSTRYALRLPNSTTDIPVGAREVFVRWNRNVADPLDVLIAGGQESPYFRDTRIPFLGTIVAQRAASGGLPALISSAVELYPHQLRAAQQVLADPIQRYLLADEVGLGKTIEAGFVLRQYLLDNPTGTVLIVAPDELRRQWQQELIEKFFIDDFPKSSIRIASHDAASSWRRDQQLGLVVVDEAHRLVQQDVVYTALEELCLHADRLLLLSATPVLHHEQQMLRLLHLLDPQMYDLDDLDGFQARVRNRHRVAMAFYALDPDFPFTIPEHTATISEAFLADQELHVLCARVDDAADADDQIELSTSIERLRAHVNEVYRLHRRIIRQRREAVVGKGACGPDSPPFEVTGRRPPTYLCVDDSAWTSRELFLAQWRSAVLQDLEDAGTPELVPQFAQIFVELLDAANDPLSAFAEALRARVDTDADVGTATAPNPGPQETRLLKAADRDHTISVTTIVLLLLPILRRHTKTLLFATSTDSAAQLVAALREHKITVAAHLRGMDLAAVESDVVAWLHGDAQVLVADRTGEEGRNFQGAEAVVHLSLPLSINRVEQRLGRVDRYGAPVPARQYLIVPDDPGTFAATWARTAVTSYRVFERSLSSLQYAVADLQLEQATLLLENGPEGLSNWHNELTAVLDQRRKEIAAEDMLEASFVSAHATNHQFHLLDALEAQWRPLERITADLLSEAHGNLKFVKQTSRAYPGAATYSPTQDTLVPADVLAEHTRNRAFESPITFNRTAALRRPGVKLARSGSVLLDGLQHFVGFDDRGQAAAWWRYRHQWRRQPEVYFGLHYLVEADIEAATLLCETAPDSKRALRRKADQFLPPFLVRFWLPAFGNEVVDDAAVLNFLTARYNPGKGGDTNLSFERTAPLLSLLNGPAGFAEACATTRTAGASAAISRADLRQRARAAAASARASLEQDIAHMEARRNSTLLAAKGERGVIGPQLKEAIVAGVASPTVRLTSVALVVLAGQGWTPDAQ